MTPKILRLVTSCGGCPNYGYYSGGAYRCNLVDETVLNKEVVAPFCPLADYPSHIIASQQMTIMDLRDPNKYGLSLGLLTHIAAKLKVNLEPSARGVTIRLKDDGKDREVYLGMDYVSKIDLHRSEITFTSGDKVYRLSPDTATLWEKADPNSEEDHWFEHRL